MTDPVLMLIQDRHRELAAQARTSVLARAAACCRPTVLREALRRLRARAAL